MKMTMAAKCEGGGRLSSATWTAATAALSLAVRVWQQNLLACELLSRRHRIIVAKLRSAKRRAALMREGSTASAQYCVMPPIRSDCIAKAVLGDDVDPTQVSRYLGVSQASFSRICRLVHGSHRRSIKEHGWPERLEVAIFLNWLASDSALRVVALRFAIPKSTVSDAILRVLDLLLRHLRRIIRLAEDEQRLDEIGRGLCELADGNRAFLMAVGCLDVMDVCVRPRPNIGEADYAYVSNIRCNLHTIRCQVVCDHRGLFRDVFAGYPGSLNDQELLVHSMLYAKANVPPENRFLLAGPNYVCTNQGAVTVITPYDEPTTSCFQGRFNACHRAAHSAATWAIERVKSRWPRLFSPTFDASVKLAPKFIVACAMLHNVCTIVDKECVPRSEQQQDQDRDSAAMAAAAASNEGENDKFACGQFANDIMLRLDHSVSGQIYTPSPQDHSYI